MAKKIAKKSIKARAKKSAAGHKRTSVRAKSSAKSSTKPRGKKNAPSLFDAFLKIFAQPETRKT
jgi:hypothetical protein